MFLILKKIPRGSFWVKDGQIWILKKSCLKKNFFFKFTREKPLELFFFEKIFFTFFCKTSVILQFCRISRFDFFFQFLVIFSRHSMTHEYIEFDLVWEKRTLERFLLSFVFQTHLWVRCWCKPRSKIREIFQNQKKYN